MNYSKPEVNTLGQAKTVIETSTQQAPTSTSGDPLKTNMLQHTTWMSNTS